MTKKKICIERELLCKSANIIWPLISTSDGMAKWIADEVKNVGNRYTFRWGELWANHDIRTATMVECKKLESVKMCWDDEPEAFFEMAIVKSELTGNHTLVITDFADKGDEDSLRALWEDDLRKLRQASGL